MATYPGSMAINELVGKGWRTIQDDPEVFGDPDLIDTQTGERHRPLEALMVQRIRESPPVGICPTCRRAMPHYRTKGYVCPHCS